MMYKTWLDEVIAYDNMARLLSSLGFENAEHLRDSQVPYDAGLTPEQKEILDKEIVLRRLQGELI